VEKIMTRYVQSKGASLSVLGEMTIYHAAQLHEQLCAGLKKKRIRKIDLSQVTELDTAGVQLLLGTQQWALQNGRELTFNQPSTVVCEVLELLQIELPGAGAGMQP
jgi:anti-sigma B factor antagonist